MDNQEQEMRLSDSVKWMVYMTSSRLRTTNDIGWAAHLCLLLTLRELSMAAVRPRSRDAGPYVRVAIRPLQSNVPRQGTSSRAGSIQPRPCGFFGRRKSSPANCRPTVYRVIRGGL